MTRIYHPEYRGRLGPREPNPEEEKQAADEAIAAIVLEVERRRKGKTMHYKNGRVAKNGDKVVIVDGYNAGLTGVLYDAQAGNDYCNGKLATIQANAPCPNLKECLHLDDVKALDKVPDSSVP